MKTSISPLKQRLTWKHDYTLVLTICQLSLCWTKNSLATHFKRILKFLMQVFFLKQWLRFRKANWIENDFISSLEARWRENSVCDVFVGDISNWW